MSAFDRKTSLFILLLTVGLPVTALAQTQPAVRTLSLGEALRLADQRELRLIVSQERVAQAMARIGQSRSALLPQLNLNAYQNRQTRDLRTAGMAFAGDPLVGPFNVFDARAQITQTIFDASALARLSAARAGQALTAAQLRQTKEDVLALVATMFVDARRAAQSVGYADTVVKKEEKKLAVAQHQQAAGTGSQPDVLQAQADHAAALRLRQQAQTTAVNARLDLLAALGLDLEGPVQFSNDDGLNFPEPDADPSLTRFEHLPDLEVAGEQLNVSRADRSTEKWEFFPKISALADYGPSGIDPSDQNETYTLGLKASFPIFDGGSRKSRVQEAESRLRESEAGFADARTQSQAKILSARESFRQAEALVAEKDAQRALAQKQLSLAQERLHNGTASEVELLEAQARDAGADDQQNEARAAFITAQIHWTRATGGMEGLLSGTTARLDSKE